MACFLLIKLAKFYQKKEGHIIYFLSFYLKKKVMKMNISEKIPHVFFVVLLILMYAYAFATGIAITHIGEGSLYECPICAAFTEVAQR